MGDQERADVEVPAQTERLMDLLHGLMKVVRPSDDMLALLLQLELTLPQILSLSRLRRGPETISSLAAGLHLTPSAVSRLVDQIVAKGLVLREEGEADRRCKTLNLSPHGRRTIEQLDGAREADFARLFTGLAPDLRNDFEAVLRRVVAAVQQQQPENAP